MRSDADAYAGLIDATVMTLNGYPDNYRRDMQLAIESGFLGPGERVFVRLGESRLVGSIGTYTREQLVYDRCEIGFSVAAEYRGRGYASEAVEGFVSHLHKCGYQIVEASTAVDNHAVHRVLDRTGFAPVEDYLRTLPNGREIQALRYEHTAMPGDRS